MRAFLGFVIAASMLYSVILPLVPGLWRELWVDTETLKPALTYYPFWNECDQFLVVLNICDFGFLETKLKVEENFKYMLFGGIDQFSTPVVLGDAEGRLTTTLGVETLMNRVVTFAVMTALCLLGLYAVVFGFGRKKRRS